MRLPERVGDALQRPGDGLDHEREQDDRDAVVVEDEIPELQDREHRHDEPREGQEAVVVHQLALVVAEGVEAVEILRAGVEIVADGDGLARWDGEAGGKHRRLRCPARTRGGCSPRDRASGRSGRRHRGG